MELKYIPIYCRLLPIYCRLLPIYCRLLPIYCRLLPIYCRVLPIYCQSIAVYCQSIAVYCQSIANLLPCIANILLYIVNVLWYIVNILQYIVNLLQYIAVYYSLLPNIAIYWQSMARHYWSSPNKLWQIAKWLLNISKHCHLAPLFLLLVRLAHTLKEQLQLICGRRYVILPEEGCTSQSDGIKHIHIQHLVTTLIRLTLTDQWSSQVRCLLIMFD